MTKKQHDTLYATGGCLCGSVQYEVRGPLRNIINCHCSKCRRTHGHIAAYTAVNRKDFFLTKQDGLKWYHSVTDESPNVHRGFCKICGSVLFWDTKGIGKTIAISAGSLDPPTGLKTIAHIWLSQAGDYYEILDELPKFEESHGGQIG